MRFIIILLTEIFGKECVDETGSYFGTTSTTKSGRTCMRWNRKSPHVPNFTPEHKSHNFCRNPDDDARGPWCYTTDPNRRFEYCDIPQCQYDSCWTAGKRGYSGMVSTTESGETCQSWLANKPHKPHFRPSDANNNYCRNPGTYIICFWKQI